jgi:hypothetical protein
MEVEVDVSDRRFSKHHKHRSRPLQSSTLAQLNFTTYETPIPLSAVWYFLAILACTTLAGVIIAECQKINAITKASLQDPPGFSPIFSSGPNDTVALSCFGPDSERKGKDPYMPGLFYQFAMNFSRLDGIYAAGLFCEDLVEMKTVLGHPGDGTVDMVEKDYDTRFGSKRVAARVQFDVDGVYDGTCKNATGKFDFSTRK